MTYIPQDKILILDGATGTMIQRHSLTESDYRDGAFEECKAELRGNSECLNLTRPEIIKSIHREYIEAGADIIETNTFSANRISQSEYGCGDYAARMAYEGARLAREVADEYMVGTSEDDASAGRRILVAGSMGPTSKSLSLSPDVSDPGFRPYSFDQMREAYREQAQALLEGGADLLLIETCFDALNVKAALAAIQECNAFSGAEYLPVIISVSVGDRSGRTLTGQTLKAFYTAISHYPILAFGLNCSLGAAEMTPLMEEISQWCDCAVSCYPNAGLPNEMGGYDQSPEDMAQAVKEMAKKGLLNIAGGCCGTTPDHIRAIATALAGTAPRQLPNFSSSKTAYFKDEKTRSGDSSSKTAHFKDEKTRSGDSSSKTAYFKDERPALTVSGLETTTVDIRHSNFTNVGERTNVAGSRKFARFISEGKYDEALQIAARQIEDGATIIDINMDDAMLDSTKEMERFVRYISNDPAVAKAALMIDSSHWETIIAGLKNAQGKCIVNSISLKEGPEKFIEKAKTIKSLGAAVVVMAFDEEGQATTLDRKIEICARAYRLLTEEAGLSPENIIFDANILSIGTGIEEHSRYAIDFIEAVRWIKSNLPGALTSGGVSNLSFSFRGNNAVREAMHSAFLYHAIKAGLDMAIVNPSMLQIYDDIEPELLKCVEDVIFDRDPQATERLIEKAARMLAQKETDNQSKTDSNSATEASTPEERLKTALIKGRSETLAADLQEAMNQYGNAVSIIEGPLMEGMETVGKMFGEGKMFLPQVVKSAKVMRDAVEILQPYMDNEASGNDSSDATKQPAKPKITLATVKGDVHDIGKNITGIVLTCNGFQIHDLGVMVDKETILQASEEDNSDIIAVSGLITPSLYQMEELCREMAARNMAKPLFIGGATTSAVHTAVKLAPLYDHVYYGPDASAAAVMAKKYIMDPTGFEAEEHKKQEELRTLYHQKEATSQDENMKENSPKGFAYETYLDACPSDIPAQQIASEEILPYFDWKMFYAIWGVKYGSSSMEAMELVQLRRDAEEEIGLGNFRVMLSARFFHAYTEDDDIVLVEGAGIPGEGVQATGTEGKSELHRIPMMRQEKGDMRSLSDFVISKESGRTSPFGCFAISVHAADAHEEGCCCPACSNKYEDLIGKAVRMTLAEAASKWLDQKILEQMQGETAQNCCEATDSAKAPLKVIKPAAGYSSCPDHTLKRDILNLLGETIGCNDAILPDTHYTQDVHGAHSHGAHCTCGRSHEGHSHGHNHDHSHCQTERDGHGQTTGVLKIRLTETCAMTPEASICGTIFLHPEAKYPEIRTISQEQHDSYVSRRGMSEDSARRFLGHLLK